MNEQELTELEKGAGIGNFVKGMAGSVMSKSGNAKQRAQGKRMRSNAAAKRAASPAGQKRKVKKLIDAMLTQWSKYENKMIVKGEKRSAQMVNQWYKNFMGPERADKIKEFSGSPTDQEIYNFLEKEVPQFAAPAKPKIPVGNKQKYKVDNETYTWKGAQWISDKTGKIAQRIVAQQLSNQAPRESTMYNKLMNKYLIESGQISENMHSQLSGYLEHNGAQIEDWRDQARLMVRWFAEFGPEGWEIKTVKQPTQTGLGTYMYVSKIADIDGNERWFAFDDEGDVAEISDKQPDPKSYS
jgi:hypothetical protein